MSTETSSILAEVAMAVSSPTNVSKRRKSMVKVGRRIEDLDDLV